MVYWWQRLIAVITTIFTDLIATYFIRFTKPQFFNISYPDPYDGWHGNVEWLVNDFKILAVEIALLVVPYIIVTKIFKHCNKMKYARDWVEQNSQLKMDENGEVTKQAEQVPVFPTVRDLMSKDDIDALHYTTLFVSGYPVTDGSRHYIVDKDETGEAARLEVIYDGSVPVPDDQKHSFNGTLMVENGRILLQWAKLCR